MGVLDSLFGSSDKGGYVGNAPLLTGGQNDILTQLTNLLQGQIGQGVTPYGGELTPGTQPLQTSSFDLINTLLKGGGLTGEASDVLSGIMKPYDPTAAQDTWQKQFVAPAMANYNNTILPSVKEGFIGQGAGRSGAANAAIAKSGSDLSTNLNSQLANMLYSGQQADVGNKLQAANQSSSLSSMLANLGLSGGAAQYGIGQAEDTAAQQNWLSAQPYNNPFLALLSQTLGTKAFEPIVQGPSSQQGMLGSLLGGAGALAGGLATGGTSSILSMLMGLGKSGISAGSGSNSLMG